ncbi:pancreatic lipase-related protein 2-like [Aplysia californica]|uniref:Pancreatic lipase-related protein 2-like n=1 Tax=Aplysia californica TaxID=6500 RepID=A0ABM0K3F5_APLCA|nr:pancreatic lipase-related protein 2-like [Aplysia californica]
MLSPSPPETLVKNACPHLEKSPKVSVTSVCYPYVGCFDDRPPFNNAAGKLPKSPTQLHGDFNVITVDWGEGAKLPDYHQAVANLRLVATQLKLLLDILQGQGLKLSDVHMIGHSLGAHMSGYVGLLIGSTIGRITGMDPADPDFQCLPSLVRLDAGDAMFVDVIHTNGAEFIKGGAGMLQQCGHVDFYVNGGETQPGCQDGVGGALSSLMSVFENSQHSSNKILLSHSLGGSVGDDVSCSHARSHDIFTESVTTNCTFTGFPCDTYEKFLSGQCSDCGTTGCSSMGYYANQFYGTGRMFLRTRISKPYCGYQYVVKVTMSSSGRDSKGTLSVALQGAYGNTSFALITPKT